MIKKKKKKKKIIKNRPNGPQRSKTFKIGQYKKNGFKKRVKIGQNWLIKTVKNSKQKATTINTGEYGQKRSEMVKSSIKNSQKMSTIVNKKW